MSYQEKRIVTSIISGIVIFLAYCFYSISKIQSQGEILLNNQKFWATTMLITIGLGIMVMMVNQLVLHVFLAISNEVKKEISKEITKNGHCGKGTISCDDSEFTSQEDEMDKLIALKATRFSLGIIGVGFVASLVTLYFQKPPGIMLNIIFISFMLSSILEGLLQIRYYRKGIYHG